MAILEIKKQGSAISKIDLNYQGRQIALHVAPSLSSTERSKLESELKEQAQLDTTSPELFVICKPGKMLAVTRYLLSHCLISREDKEFLDGVIHQKVLLEYICTKARKKDIVVSDTSALQKKNINKFHSKLMKEYLLTRLKKLYLDWEAQSQRSLTTRTLFQLGWIRNSLLELFKSWVERLTSLDIEFTLEVVHDVLIASHELFGSSSRCKQYFKKIESELSDAELYEELEIQLTQSQQPGLPH